MLTILFLTTFATLVIGGIPLWRVAFHHWQQSGSLLDWRYRISSPLGLVDVLIMFVTWVFGQIASTALAVLVLDVQPDTISSLSGSQMAVMAIMVAIGQLLFTALGLEIIWLRYQRWEIFGIQPKMLRWDTVLGILAFVMVVPAVLIVQWLLTFLVKYEHGTLELLMKDSSILTLAGTWFAAVLVAPICEEIFFRGILQSWLQRLGHKSNATVEKTVVGGWQIPTESPLNPTPDSRDSSGAFAANENSIDSNPYQSRQELGINKSKPVDIPYVQFDSSATWMPMIVSAAVFGLAHIGQGAAPIPLFLFGLALGYLYRQTGSIWPCIVLHMGLNGFSMFWFTLQVLFPGADVVPAPTN